MRRLARLSRKHGLNWASNVIVGHPGETMRSMQETHTYLRELFTSAPETCGWLSIDPFRLYPGAQVHEAMQVYAELHGTRFHHPRWWTTWYDAPFLAEHIDPSREVDFETRVRFMYEAYGPLIEEIQRRFRGQGRSVDRVFARSVAEQARLMSPTMRDSLLRQAARARRLASAPRAEGDAPALTFPVGLHVKNPWVRRRESAVRRLLDDGVLRTTDLVEALLQVAPERHDAAEAMLTDELPEVEHEGELPVSLTLRAYALGLEALEPALGDEVADLTARSGYLPSVLARLVGEHGRVVALGRCVPGAAAREPDVPHVAPIEWRDPGDTSRFALAGVFDGLWIGAAIPRVPPILAERLRLPEGRAIAFVGPRFRAQDLVALTRREDGLHERRVARVLVPVLGGRDGWVREPIRPSSSTPASPSVALADDSLDTPPT